MKTPKREKERRDSILIMLLIMLLGFLCILLTSGWALRFAPQWKLPANMESNLNPDGHFLTDQPVNLIEPLDPAILTNPAWYNVYLTPGATFSTWTPAPTATATSVVTNTLTAFTVTPPLFTNTSIPSASPTVTSTIPYYPPPPPSTSTPKPKPKRRADLQITKTDNATSYVGGISVRYVIVVSNAGPANVNGVTVKDAFSADLTNITWTCAGSGGSCTAGGNGNINDSAVNLPAGTSVTYTVGATVVANPVGPTLSNTATVTAPSGVNDPNPGNNSASDNPADTLIVVNPPGNIGSSPDCPSASCTQNLPPGSFTTLQFATPLVVGGHAGYDLVYYPDPAAPTLQMDLVILQISDGSNWYTIFNWGDGSPDVNTDINPTDCPSETDNCVITTGSLVNSPGVSIELDGVVPNGTYPYIRIISPSAPPDSGDGVDVDAITVLP